MWRPVKVRLHALYNLLHQENTQPKSGAYVRLYNSVSRTTGNHPVPQSQALPAFAPSSVVNLDITLAQTTLLPAMPKANQQPIRTTDKFNLHDIALVSTLKTSIEAYEKRHGRLPNGLRMTTATAYKLAQAGFCHEGHFCYNQVEILIIPDENLNSSDICLDHYQQAG